MSLIAVCCGKGSPGTTFVAVNLTRALAVRERPALYVDADPSGGDAAAYLGLDPRKGLYPLRLFGSGYSKERIFGEIEQRGGIACISGFPRARDSLDPRALRDVLDACNDDEEITIADLGRIQPAFAPCADSADLILMVVRPNLVSIHGAERAINELVENEIDISRISLVVNTWKLRNAADIAEIGETLGTDVLGMIPWDGRSARRALQNQTPLDRGRAFKAFRNLALKVEMRVSDMSVVKEVAIA